MIRNLYLAAAAAACLSAAWAAPAIAQSDPQWDICQGVDPRDPKTTIDACRASLSQMIFDNERADAYNNLGVAYGRDGQEDKAQSSFNEAMRAIRGHREPEYRQLSDMIRLNRAKSYTVTGDYESAVADYDELIKHNPADRSLLVARGANQEALSRKNAGRSDAAGALALEAEWRNCDGPIGTDSPRELLKDRAGACKAIAESDSMPKEIRDAAAHIQEGLNLALAPPDKALHDLPPAAADATARQFYASAVMHYRSGKHELAITELNRSIEKDPDNADAYGLRCHEYVTLDRNLDQALADCDKAVKLKPDFALFVLTRGELREKLGRYPEAESDFNQLVTMDPDSSAGLLDRCQTRALWGQKLYEAMTDCSTFLNKGGRHVFAYESLALISWRQERYANVIDQADKSLGLSPKRAPALYLRGLARLKTGDAAGGKSDIAVAKAIDPKIAETYAGYGVRP